MALIETWNCDVCHQKRPDAKISVLSKPVKGYEGIEVTQNIKYCNDREPCRYGAENLELICGTKEETENNY